MKKMFFLLLISAMAFLAGCGDSFYYIYDDITGPVQSVKIRNTMSVVAGQKEQLHATVYPLKTPNKKVTWESNEESIVSVDSDTGEVTASSNVGASATITVTTDDGNFTDECIVTVVPVPVPIEFLNFSPATITIGINADEALEDMLDIDPDNATSIEMKWKSSNVTVASVDSDTGIVTGHSVGTVNITATSVYWGKSATITVTVATMGNPPTVTTTAIAGNIQLTPYIAGTTARGGGDVSNSGTTPVTARGLCWSTTQNPTLSNYSASSGSGTGGFVVTMNSLAKDTVYYVRAYATNSFGTSYGEQVSFNTGKSFGTLYGGYVFYNDGNGGGIAADIEDWSISAESCWSYTTNVNIIGLSTDVETGDENTDLIRNYPGTSYTGANPPVHWISAAKRSYDHTRQISGVTYTDWFLPSINELDLIYKNLKVAGLGNLTQTSSFWSSSHADSINGYCLNMGTGEITTSSKGTALRFRAVRKF